MNDFLPFVWLGFRHITDFNGADHMLFLLALAVIYRGRDWRDALWVISAFTVGHSITLGLAVTSVIQPSERLVEFLIPVTILATAVENVAVRDHTGPGRRRYRPVFAGVFGLVHGAGFAGYLKSLFMDRIAVPLFGFNVGIELGQVVALLVIALLLAALDRLLRRLGAAKTAGTVSVLASPFRLRVVGLSAMIALVAAGWAVERRPW